MRRRFKSIPHEIHNILRLYPRCTDAYLDLACVKLLWLYLCQRLYVYGILRVVLCIDLRRFQLVTDIAA